MARASAAVAAGLVACATVSAQAPIDARSAAIDAGAWIASHTIETDAGVTWPIDPEDGGERADNLYSGASGVVLFFSELWRATGEARWLELASRGADNLIADLPEALGEGEAGLYTGVAGIGFALERAHAATGEARHRAGALRCVELIKAGAIAEDAGVHWGPVTDIIAGSAGTGLFLLWAHETYGDAEALALAAQAGRSLLARAIETDHGLTWRMTPDYERLMPNFSHGTAGVAFFLARLYEATGEDAFLSGAWKGADELRAIADTSEMGFKVLHHSPGGEDLYYLGWCHGPAGTARLFAQMQRVSALPEWGLLQSACARSLAASGAPEVRSAGYWENVSRCCGSAGMGDFYLMRHSAGQQDADLAVAERCVRDVLSRGTRDEAGLKWVQAEHRARPELLVAQTGLAQGASGIGLTLLRYDAAVTGRAWTLRLPDEVR